MHRFLATMAIAALPTMAPAWVAGNGLVVEERGNGFTIPYRGLSGARDFWCAAGEYVIDHLGMRPDTRIYRTSSPPRRAGDGISFSLSSEGAKKPGIILLGGERGVSASHARSFCSILRIERES